MKKIFLLLIIISIPALGSEIIDKRKQLFQENKDHMRFIYKAMQSGDMDPIINSSMAIEKFASEMPEYFPEGSESRGASDNIWSDFEGFIKSAKANQLAAQKLKLAAQENEIEELNGLFNELSNTCKSCHRSYKN